MPTMYYIEIGNCYQLINDFTVQTSIMGYVANHPLYRLTADGKLLMRTYFTWDGPTGAFNTKNFIIPSAVHDALCNLINLGYLPMSLQPMVDEEMIKFQRRAKMCFLRRAWTYTVVRWYQMTKKKRTKIDIKSLTI